MIVSRSSPRSAKYARMSMSPVSSPCDPAAGCSVTAGRPAISARISCRRHISSSAPCASSSSCMRVQVAEPRKPGRALVHARVVLHRAGAERIEARVDAEGAVGERREVADELGLRELGKARRASLGAAPSGSSGTGRSGRGGRPARRPARERSKISGASGQALPGSALMHTPPRAPRPAGRRPRRSASP